MALIKCPDCGTDVSDAAAACPKCACPIAGNGRDLPTAPTRKPRRQRLSGGFVLLVLACLGFWLYFQSINSGSPQQSAAPATSSDDSKQAAQDAEAAQAAAVRAEEDRQQNQQAQSAPTESIAITTPQELFSRYNANEVATDQALAGKIIQITAPVKSIDKDFTDTAVLKFATDDSDFDDMSAALDDSEKDRAAHLSKGQIVAVQCKTMHRIMNSPAGSDCVFVKSPAPVEPVSNAPASQPDQPDAAPAVSNPSTTATFPNGAKITDSDPANEQVSSFTPPLTPLQKVVANASGPSFDCSATSDLTAKVICGNPQLSLLDRQMAILYYTRTDYATNAATRDFQRGWIHDRDSSCIDNTDCLTARYGQRIKQLQGQPFSGSMPDTQTRVVGSDSGELNQYATALQGAIHQQWIRPKTLPNGSCVVHIEQLPGGAVVSAKVDASCPYDDQDRASVENAVWSAQPLPYKGFENVFQRDVDVTFAP